MVIGRVRYDVADTRLGRHWQDEEDLRIEVLCVCSSCASTYAGTIFCRQTQRRYNWSPVYWRKVQYCWIDVIRDMQKLLDLSNKEILLSVEYRIGNRMVKLEIKEHMEILQEKTSKLFFLRRSDKTQL